MATQLCGNLLLRRLVESILAIALMAAAILKAYQLFSGVTPNDDLLSKPGIAALIQLESSLAIWLIVGGVPRIRLYCTALCFCAFTTVAIHDVARHAPTCGCFGQMQTRPIWVAGFDAISLIALWIIHLGDTVSVDKPISRTRANIGFSLVWLFTILLWIGYVVVRMQQRPISVGSVFG